MGFFRKPQGTYSRQTPDLFLGNAGMVGGFYWSSLIEDTRLSIFNAAEQGTYCHIYKIFVGNDAAGVYSAGPFRGPGQTQLIQALPVVAGNPAPNVFLYRDLLAPLYSGLGFPKDIDFDGYIWADNEAGSQDQYAVNGPIAVLPPGWSFGVRTFVSSSDSNSEVITCSFYFVMLPDQG